MARPPGTYILPMLHPATFFRNQTYAFTGVADWEKAVRVQRDGPTIVHPPIEEWQWRPTLLHVQKYMTNMMRGGLPYIESSDDPGPWSIDFEATLNREVVCLGIWSCHEPAKHRGICIPFLSQYGAKYWSAQDEQIVFGMVRDFFTDPRREKIGQNTVGYDTGYPPFNSHALIKEAWGIDVQGLIGDTMVAHHTCFSELKHSLAFQASIATDLSPYKEELWDDDENEEDDSELDWTRILERPDERVRKYNLKDAFAQAVIWNELEREMA
jgi:hypothetical protein